MQWIPRKLWPEIVTVGTGGQLHAGNGCGLSGVWRFGGIRRLPGVCSLSHVLLPQAPVLSSSLLHPVVSVRFPWIPDPSQEEHEKWSREKHQAKSIFLALSPWWKFGRNCFCKLFKIQVLVYFVSKCNILQKSAQIMSGQLSEFPQHEGTFVTTTQIKV